MQHNYSYSRHSRDQAARLLLQVLDLRGNPHLSRFNGVAMSADSFQQLLVTAAQQGTRWLRRLRLGGGSLHEALATRRLWGGVDGLPFVIDLTDGDSADGLPAVA